MGQILKRTSFAVLAGLLFSAFSPTFAADFPFSDVPVSDAIHNDLQKLYERGVVDAPSDGKFHPDSLMDRDEFVSIAV
ncbi:MAG: S-layer homology domain-containing protein [Patescibacteria group bacterium]